MHLRERWEEAAEADEVGEEVQAGGASLQTLEKPRRNQRPALSHYHIKEL